MSFLAVIRKSCEDYVKKKPVHQIEHNKETFEFLGE